MTRAAKILGVIGLVVACAGIAMAADVVKKVLPSGSWRYKITVSVDTPEGPKTGSAVRQVNAFTEIGGGDVSSMPTYGHAGSNGEAVAVDLGKRGVLFGLTSVDDYQLVFKAFPIPGEMGGGLTPKGINYYSHLKNVKATLQPADFSFVKFRDPNDPKTVEKVAPDNLAASFGVGVKLNAITIEMTNESVTLGIEKWLRWLPRLQGGYLDGQSAGGGPELSNILFGGNFKTGDLK